MARTIDCEGKGSNEKDCASHNKEWNRFKASRLYRLHCGWRGHLAFQNEMLGHLFGMSRPCLLPKTCTSLNLGMSKDEGSR